MSAPTHLKLIRKKRKRRKKLAQLRKKYLLAKTEAERNKILEKVARLAPWLSKDEFLAPLKNKNF